MEHLVRWMNQTSGRVLRAGAGLALLVGGTALGGPTGIALAVVGLVALVAGGAGLCLLAPIAHLSLREGTR
jgi:Protein of unknown function (DUF2892)